MIDLTGRTIGPYQILDRLGAEPSSRIYKARHLTSGRLVALALSAPGASPDPGTQDQFRRQAAALAALQHPNIVPAVDSGADRGFYFLAADFVDGPDLRRVLQEQRQQNRRLGAQQIARIIAAVGNALDYAHGREVLHQDVRPANILFSPDDRVLLTGFGRAWLAGLTPQPGGITSPYRSPEQTGRSGVDPRADLYALGVVLYEMLTGQTPAAAGTEPAFPPGFDPILQKALAPAPAARYQSGAELAAAVQQAVAPAPLAATPLPDAVSRSAVPPGPGSETEKMIVCPNCQGVNPPGSRFCDQCAAPLASVPAQEAGTLAWPGLSRTMLPPNPPVAPGGPMPPGPAPPTATSGGPPATTFSPPPFPATPPGAGAPIPTQPEAARESRPAPPLSPTTPGGPVAGTNLPPGAALPARRRDPVLLMIGGALAALALFLVVGVAALVLGGAVAPTPTPGPAPEVGKLKTQLAEQANQLAATQTAIALGNTTATAHQTAVAQESVIAGAIQATSTALAAAQPPTAPPEAPASPTAVAAPSVQPTLTNALGGGLLPGIPTGTPTGIVSVSTPDLPDELKAYFTTFYLARTLTPGGHFDIATTRDITASPYREYTLNLLQQNQADVDAGKLQEVTYSNISVQVVSQGTDANNTPTVLVQLTRTVTEVRAGSPPAPQTGTYQFRLRRLAQPVRGVVWQAYDFYNPATNTWISGGS